MSHHAASGFVLRQRQDGVAGTAELERADPLKIFALEEDIRLTEIVQGAASEDGRVMNDVPDAVVGRTDQINVAPQRINRTHGCIAAAERSGFSAIIASASFTPFAIAASISPVAVAAIGSVTPVATGIAAFRRLLSRRTLHRGRFHPGFPRLFSQQGLAREFHSILVIDGDDFDLHQIADFADFLDPIHVFVVEFADVTQAVTAREDLDERPEFFH
jgi:hypothetical protein